MTNRVGIRAKEKGGGGREGPKNTTFSVPFPSPFPNSLKGGVHISVHVHDSKCFFLFLINFMALKIPLMCTSVITFYNISPSKMTDDQNSQKLLVNFTHIVDTEFSVDP